MKIFSNITLQSSVRPIFFLTAFCLSLTACGKISKELTGNLNSINNSDFQRTTIISYGPVKADGTSQMLVIIRLMNSDGSVVTPYQPTYSITPSTGVTTQDCTTSDSNGVSTCILTSSQAGTKTLSITNISATIQAQVTFSSLTGPPIIGSAAANSTQTKSTFNLSAVIGGPQNPIVSKKGVFTLYGSVKGEEVSR